MMRFRLHLLAVLLLFSHTTQPYSMRQTVCKPISRMYKQLLRAKEAFAVIGFFSGITLLCLWCGQHTPEQTTPSEQKDDNNTEHEDQEQQESIDNTNTNNTTSATPNNRSCEQRSSDPALLTEQEQQLNEYRRTQQQKAAQTQQFTAQQKKQDHKMALQLQKQEAQNHTNNTAPRRKKTPGIAVRFNVPYTLREKKIAHLESISQKNSTCGWWTLANALALQQLMLENKAINANNIANYARNYYNQMRIQYPNNNKDGWLNDKELIDIAKSMDLANLFIGEKNQLTTEIKIYERLDDVNYVTLHHIIERQVSGIINFAYCYKKHWVLMSMVKKPDKQSYLVYMDSRNQLLDDNKNTAQVVFNLYQQLFDTTCIRTA